MQLRLLSTALAFPLVSAGLWHSSPSPISASLNASTSSPSEPSTISTGAATFSNRDLRGRYAFHLEGEILAGPGAGPLGAIGLFVADGSGSITFATRTVQAGGAVIQEDEASGTYSILPTGLGRIDFLTSTGAIESFEISLQGQDRLLAIASDPNVVALGEAQRQELGDAPGTFDESDFCGDFAIRLNANLASPAGSSPAVGIGYFRLNGAGLLTEGTRRVSAFGALIEQSYVGTYQVDPEGTGNIQFLTTGGITGGFDFVLVNKDLNYGISTSPGEPGVGIGYGR